MSHVDESNPYLRDPPQEFDPVESLSRAEAERQAERLREAIREHDHRYYIEAEPLIADRVYDLLERRGAALCIFELAGRRSPVEVTAPFTYVRLHGPDEAYRGRYDGRALAGWARRFVTWREEGRDVFCYFDNDEAGHAPRDAARLVRMLANRRPDAGRQH
ncbi:MAG: DUF72 domain-containing protein [Pseudomonadota bacterium]